MAKPPPTIDTIGGEDDGGGGEDNMLYSISPAASPRAPNHPLPTSANAPSIAEAAAQALLRQQQQQQQQEGKGGAGGGVASPPVTKMDSAELDRMLHDLDEDMGIKATFDGEAGLRATVRRGGKPIASSASPPSVMPKMRQVDSLGFSITEEGANDKDNDNDNDSVVSVTPLPQLVVSDRIKERLKSLRISKSPEAEGGGGGGGAVIQQRLLSPRGSAFAGLVAHIQQQQAAQKERSISITTQQQKPPSEEINNRLPPPASHESARVNEGYTAMSEPIRPLSNQSYVSPSTVPLNVATSLKTIVGQTVSEASGFTPGREAGEGPEQAQGAGVSTRRPSLGEPPAIVSSSNGNALSILASRGGGGSSRRNSNLSTSALAVTAFQTASAMDTSSLFYQEELPIPPPSGPPVMTTAVPTMNGGGGGAFEPFRPARSRSPSPSTEAFLATTMKTDRWLSDSNSHGRRERPTSNSNHSNGSDGNSNNKTNQHAGVAAAAERGQGGGAQPPPAPPATQKKAAWYDDAIPQSRWPGQRRRPMSASQTRPWSPSRDRSRSRGRSRGRSETPRRGTNSMMGARSPPPVILNNKWHPKSEQYDPQTPIYKRLYQSRLVRTPYSIYDDMEEELFPLGPEYTFHPHTDASRFFRSRNTQWPDTPLLERLYDIDKTSKKFEKLELLKWERESEGCVFIPNAWRTHKDHLHTKKKKEEEDPSKQGGNNKNDKDGGADIWDRLYGKGKDSMKKRKEAADKQGLNTASEYDPAECTFMPKLLTSHFNKKDQQKENEAEKGAAGGDEASTVYDRLYKESRKRLERIKARMATKPMTGGFTFRPALSPRIQRDLEKEKSLRKKKMEANKKGRGGGGNVANEVVVLEGEDKYSSMGLTRLTQMYERGKERLEHRRQVEEARKPRKPGGYEQECTFFPKTYWKEWLALQKAHAEKERRRKEQEEAWGSGRRDRGGNNNHDDDDDYHEELFDDEYVYQSHAGIWAA